MFTAIHRDRARSIPDECYVRNNLDRPIININRLSNKPLPRKVSLGEKMRVEAKKQRKTAETTRGKGKSKARIGHRGKAKMTQKKHSSALVK